MEWVYTSSVLCREKIDYTEVAALALPHTIMAANPIYEVFSYYYWYPRTKRLFQYLSSWVSSFLIEPNVISADVARSWPIVELKSEEEKHVERCFEATEKTTIIFGYIGSPPQFRGSDHVELIFIRLSSKKYGSHCIGNWEPLLQASEMMSDLRFQFINRYMGSNEWIHKRNTSDRIYFMVARRFFSNVDCEKETSKIDEGSSWNLSYLCLIEDLKFARSISRSPSVPLSKKLSLTIPKMHYSRVTLSKQFNEAEYLFPTLVDLYISLTTRTVVKGFDIPRISSKSVFGARSVTQLTSRFPFSLLVPGKSFENWSLPMKFFWVTVKATIYAGLLIATYSTVQSYRSANQIEGYYQWASFEKIKQQRIDDKLSAVPSFVRSNPEKTLKRMNSNLQIE